MIDADSTHRDIDIPELLALLRQGRWLLGGILAGTLVLGGLWCLLAPPVYRSDALVQVETDQKSVNALLGDVAELLGAQTPVAAELEILRSRLVVGEAVDRLDLEIVAEPVRWPVIGGALARWFGSDERIAVEQLDVPAAALDEWLTLQVTDAGYVLYDAAGELALSARPGEAAQAGGIGINVRELRASPGTEFRLMRRDYDELLRDLSERLDIAERGKQSGIIGITFEDRDRARAAAFVNALVNAYLKQNVARKAADAEQSLAFLETQLPKVRESVEAAEAALSQYQLRQGSANLGTETELLLQHSVALESQRVQAEQNREALLQRFTASHPVIQSLDAQLREVGREQAQVLAKVRQLPAAQQDLLRLTRDAQVNAQIYTLLLNSAQELQLAKAGTIGNVRVIDTARERLKPAHPQPALVMGLSAALGLALGILGVFLRRALQQGVEDPAIVERTLGLPTYATVPYTRKQRRFAKLATAGPCPVLAEVDPGDPAIEALRSLRTSLHFASADSRSNVLVLTGPTEGLGKSFLTMNLATVLASARKSVVVVDADLRRGRLHEFAGGPRGPGLSELAAGTATLEQCLRRGPGGVSIITTGTLPPNPAELLMSDAFAQLLGELSRRHDHVLVDTPPVLAVTDATLIGRHAGALLLVLKAGAHPLRVIEDALRRLRQAGVVVQGSIFNQAGRGGTPYAYQYIYEYRAEAPRKAG